MEGEVLADVDVEVEVDDIADDVAGCLVYVSLVGMACMGGGALLGLALVVRQLGVVGGVAVLSVVTLLGTVLYGAYRIVTTNPKLAASKRTLDRWNTAARTAVQREVNALRQDLGTVLRHHRHTHPFANLLLLTHADVDADRDYAHFDRDNDDNDDDDDDDDDVDPTTPTPRATNASSSKQQQQQKQRTKRYKSVLFKLLTGGSFVRNRKKKHRRKQKNNSNNHNQQAESATTATTNAAPDYEAPQIL